MSSSTEKKRRKRRKKDSTSTISPSLSQTGELLSQSINMATYPGGASPNVSGGPGLQYGQYGNFPQQFSLQSSPQQYAQQTPATPVSNFVQQMPPNNWMQDLFSKLDRMEIKLNKLDTIENSVASLGNRVDKLETEIKSKVKDMEESVDFISKKYDDHTRENAEIKKEIRILTEETRSAGGSALREEINALTEKVVDVQARSMRNNLIFKGIPEIPLGIRENSEGTVKTFIEDKLGITDDISFVRVHRLGRDKRIRPKVHNDSGQTQSGDSGSSAATAASGTQMTQPGPRPIVAMFERYKDREQVRQCVISGTLINTGFYVDEQFPREIEDKRRPLYTVRSVAKAAGDECSLVVDRLYINNELYRFGKPVKFSNSPILRKVHDPIRMKEERRNRWRNQQMETGPVVPEESAASDSTANHPSNSEA